MRFVRFLAVAALVGAAACDDLEVTNPNNPDRGRVLADPPEVEALAATQFGAIVNATTGATARTQTGMATASLMNSSGLANNCMGPRSNIPRASIDNSLGNACAGDNFNDFRLLSGVTRNSTDILLAANAEGFNFGSTAAAEGRKNRLKAFAHFTNALAYGYISLVYDSSGVARVEDPDGFIPPLESYQSVNEYALAQFDSAIAYASRPGTPALEGGWLNGDGASAEVSMAEFIRVINSYKAHVRADVARNQAERAAVNWNAVIAEATNGIQSNWMVRTNPQTDWDYGWLSTGTHYRDPNWHQMTYYIIGMADVSGGYDTWLATPRDDRSYFTMITPDLRFPQGATRALQTRSEATDDDPLPAGQYFRNRNPGKDAGSEGWRSSQYDHYRHRAWADVGRIGEFPILTKAQVDMLAAEGYIRTGNTASAAELINRTRVPAGLPAVTGAGPVPGGAECVPRVPSATGGTSCGDLMEAMKWETRIETAYTSYGAWFFVGRGWGDLHVGTAIQWPVPVNELDARQLPSYNLGGVGQPGGATESTYGFGVGSR